MITWSGFHVYGNEGKLRTEKKPTAKKPNNMIKVILMLVFVAIVIMPGTTNADDPTAVAITTDITTAGGTLYSFTVRYTDDGPLLDTFDNDDVRISGPGGFDVPAAFVSVMFNANGNQAVATYSIVPPGGSWDFADNGTYTAVMQENQVFDSLGNPVAPGNIGSFMVMAPSSTPTPTPGTLGNISTRLRVEAGENVLIGGFIITGTQPKKVILRALGPSLSSFFSGTLADPILELHGPGGFATITNDNWRSDQEAEIIATTVPPSNDLESAIVATLPANNSAYTAIVRGVNNGTGIGVVEAYDLDRTVDSKLANISTRGFVQTGDNVLIGGLIVLGQNPLRVIVRAIGPSLPVSGALPDPTLELHDGNGALVASNDNWRSDQEAEIIATTIPPTNDLESAIVRDLAPAAYTAIVRGANNTTGVALVEVYALQ
jgi:hypothetical protein